MIRIKFWFIPLSPKNMRFFPAIIFLLFSSFIFSQNEKGNFLFNLNGHLRAQANFGENAYRGNMSFKLGYFFADDFLFGARYDPYYTINFLDRTNFNILGQGIFSRYYIGKNKSRLFLQTELNQQRFTALYRRTEWNLGMGFSFFLADHAALEFMVDYNLLLKETDQYPFIIPQDPIWVEYYSPQKKLVLSIGLNFYLSRNRRAGERLPLHERYLKKGNRSFTASGNLSIEDLLFVGVFEKNKFVSDRIRRRHRIFGFGVLPGKDDRYGLKIYSLLHDFFVPTSESLYFTSSLGLGPMVNYYDNLSTFNIGVNASGELGIKCFFKNANFGTGISMSLFDYFKKGLEAEMTANLYLDSEIFITDNLAIHPIIYYSITDNPTILYFFEMGRFVQVYDLRLQFGINYYY